MKKKIFAIIALVTIILGITGIIQPLVSAHDPRGKSTLGLISVFNLTLLE